MGSPLVSPPFAILSSTLYLFFLTSNALHSICVFLTVSFTRPQMAIPKGCVVKTQTSRTPEVSRRYPGVASHGVRPLSSSLEIPNTPSAPKSQGLPPCPPGSVPIPIPFRIPWSVNIPPRLRLHLTGPPILPEFPTRVLSETKIPTGLQACIKNSKVLSRI